MFKTEYAEWLTNSLFYIILFIYLFQSTIELQVSYRGKKSAISAWSIELTFFYSYSHIWDTVFTFVMV